MSDQDKNNEVTVFAKTNFRNQEVPFGIKTDDRRRHMYVIGKTGMGKTTLMENMIIQDIMNGKGLAFVDPHGDSVEKILDYIPNNRVNDVVYFNPADQDFPIAFNILESVDPSYKHLVASGLMGVFTKIWANTWSARMEYILNNAILALLDSPGNTLLGIARMIVDKKYRKKIVDNIRDPMVRSFWVDEFANWPDKYRMEAVAPIQNKVGQFLSTSIIRNIIGQSKSTIDLRDIMDNKKILLLNLSKGRLGEDNSALLGAMIITKLQLAALSRVDILEHDREDFYLYVDEFQNFATQSFATILSEARKYRLNLVIGHQYIGQLIQDKSTEVRDAVFGNVGTIVCFRVGATDAEFLEKEFFPTFLENDLLNLPKYHIILRLMINGVASDPFSATTLSPAAYQKTVNREKVIRVSRERYANPAQMVMKKITEWMGQEYHEGVAVVATGIKFEGRDDDEELRPQTAQPAPATPVSLRPAQQPVAEFKMPEAVHVSLPVEQIVDQPVDNAPEVYQVAAATAEPRQQMHAQAELVEELPQTQNTPAASPPVQQVRPIQGTQTQGLQSQQRQPQRQQGQGGNQHSHQQRQNYQPENRQYQQRPQQQGGFRERRSTERRKSTNRKANPIWDKVASIKNENEKNLVKTLADGFGGLQKNDRIRPKERPPEPKAESQNSSNLSQGPQQQQASSQQQTGAHDQQHIVLKPGEKTKF